MKKVALAVSHLQTEFVTRAGIARAVNDVSLFVEPGEILGLVGESGSGKSMTGFSILGLVERPGRVVGGKIELTGADGKSVDLRQLDDLQMRSIRGNRIAMIFQDPMMTLNPVLKIGTQMMETVRAHNRVSKKEAYRRAVEALQSVGIPAAEQRMAAYPHQFSGGMRQRVVIAIALLNKPDVIIADEPTTALDVTIQGQILFQMQKICRDSGTALIWITHDLSVVSELADRVSVMYAGKIVESGSTRQILELPGHPYTQGLIRSTPSANIRGVPLKQIPGMTPSLVNLPGGCAFRDRCEFATAQCETTPALESRRDKGSVRCFHPLTQDEEVFA
ncbi:ABC transporter ATP-binding protein [Burkholderia sp. L27(2015)]|uniref:ABC transporter ATP-binding protein n=1 Tax=Burkholderia sp. L27(2015) TaxID=1641858 RepID=UPI00131EADE0|nr:ABC transporter ATP-binding protein [Burkholderia sp. L27(2015)]